MGKFNTAISTAIIYTAATVTALVTGAPFAQATQFTAGVVLEKMKGRERFAFIAGIVEGLAIARYESGDRDPKTLKCFYDWFYADVKIMDDIEQVFAKYPDYPPGSVISVMIEDKCGG